MITPKTHIQKHPLLSTHNLKFFNIETLVIQSQTLKNNPLKDPTLRHNPILIPRKVKHDLPVILVLSGFTGNGPQSFNLKTFEENFPQSIDKWFYKNKSFSPLVVFIDAMTFWGGSQFINSIGSGNYEDYIMKELIHGIKQNYSIKTQPQYWCVMGGSSGGYGALHLASRYPHQIGLTAALAPDSAFELSLLPEIYLAFPIIQQLGGVKKIKQLMKAGKLQKQKDFHRIINVLGMAACYSKHYKKDEDLFPINPQTGSVIAHSWKEWKKKDPIKFLKKRNLKALHGILLDVGKYDQFNLQYGARRIKEILKEKKIKLDYSEFDGGHFDISSRRPLVWQWLSQRWSH